MSFTVVGASTHHVGEGSIGSVVSSWSHTLCTIVSTVAMCMAVLTSVHSVTSSASSLVSSPASSLVSSPASSKLVLPISGIVVNVLQLHSHGFHIFHHGSHEIGHIGIDLCRIGHFLIVIWWIGRGEWWWYNLLFDLVYFRGHFIA